MIATLNSVTCPRSLGKSSAYNVHYRLDDGTILCLRAGVADVPTKTVEHWIRPDDWNRDRREVTEDEWKLVQVLAPLFAEHGNVNKLPKEVEF